MAILMIRKFQYYKMSLTAAASLLLSPFARMQTLSHCNLQGNS